MSEMNKNPEMSETSEGEKGYSLAFKEDGVFLTVYPYMDDSVLFELTDISKILHDHGVMDYRIETIAKIMREGKGEEMKIAENVGWDNSKEQNANSIEKAESETEMGDSSVEETKLNTDEGISKEDEIKAEPVIDISISKDRMEAALHIEINENSKKPTEDMLRAKIKERGIVFGIREEAIQNIVKFKVDDVIIAEGIPPVNGTNAYIVKKFEAENKGRPEKLEDGKVDFKNLNLFTIVKEGTLLAERIPQTQGIAGTDVLGGTVAAKPGKAAMLPAGKNTKIVDDHKIISAIDGQVIISGNKISVDPTIQINGDVDLSTGNIEFNGSIIVKGSVQAGFSIKAEGDVEVAGTISGGTVEARNVTVRAGIQGMQRGHIIAREDIRSSFAENAKIIAGRDAIISEAILHSSVSAGKRIIVQGRRGVISGGSAVAGEMILVKCAGNQMDTSTKLEVGINPMLREEYQTIRKKYAQAQEELDQAQKALTILKAMDPEQLSESKKELFLRLTKSQFPLAGKVKQYRDRIMQIEEAFENLREGKIRVSEFVYPGVKLVVGSVIKHIRSKEQHCTFYVENGEIKTGPY